MAQSLTNRITRIKQQRDNATKIEAVIIQEKNNP